MKDLDEQIQDASKIANDKGERKQLQNQLDIIIKQVDRLYEVLQLGSKPQ